MKSRHVLVSEWNDPVPQKLEELLDLLQNAVASRFHRLSTQFCQSLSYPLPYFLRPSRTPPSCRSVGALRPAFPWLVRRQPRWTWPSQSRSAKSPGLALHLSHYRPLPGIRFIRRSCQSGSPNLIPCQGPRLCNLGRFACGRRRGFHSRPRQSAAPCLRG